MYRMGQPGQRTTSRQDLKTEVQITLRHIAWSTAFGLVLVIVSRAFLLALLREAVQAWALLEWPARVLYVWWLKIGLPLVPLLTVGSGFVSFVIQVFDINWPPPRSAQRAADGPNAPRILRNWLRPDAPQPDLMPLELEGKQPDLPEITRRIEADLTTYRGEGERPTRTSQHARTGATLWAHGGKVKQQLRLAHPELDVAQWQGICRAFRNNASMSWRDLHNEGGLSQPKAKAAAQELARWPDLCGREDNQKRFPTREFRHWVLGEAWKKVGG